MAAALELTSEPDWQSRYDITVYQMGWRLGGKGASGRGENCRIEEHGLHIWMGFYENAFRLIREVYEENKVNRPKEAPLQEWSDAFKPHNFIALTDRNPNTPEAAWQIWPFHFPKLWGTPGDGVPQTIWDIFLRFIDGLDKARADRVPQSLAQTSQSFHQANIFAQSLAKDPRQHTAAQRAQLVQYLHAMRNETRQASPAGVTAVSWSQLAEIINIGATVMIGMIEDGYLTNPAGLDQLEDELQDWLKKHGATQSAYDVNQSTLLRALYDLVFAYVNGDVNRPSFEAGVGLRCILLIVAAYKGAIFWKMQAGMGDVVFGPIYEVLKRRGVKFEFFHRVTELKLNPQGSAVSEILVDVQATLVKPQTEYLPLISCQGLTCCWPANPLYNQLEQGNELRAGCYNLESFWTTWQSPEHKVLESGKDFDQIVLGISVAGLPYLFREPEKLSTPFQKMMQNVQTVATQAAQFWVNCSLDDLGWTQGSVVLDAFQNPLNTWAVMDQLLPRENWPPGEVAGIHYFCGPMAGGIAKRSDKNEPARALKLVSAAAEDLTQKYLPALWPKMNDNKVKMVAKFVRANIDPTERYVLSIPCSTKFRLKANESGLSNVILAGDWTKNGFNAGCVEAAVMSGMQAANAIKGRPLNYGVTIPLELPDGKP